MADQIVLTYWPFHGLAGTLRLALVHAVGVDGFVNNFVENDQEWSEIVLQKADENPLLNMPCIQFPGSPVLGQSMAILRAIGRRYNFLGETNADQERTDEVLSIMADYHVEHVKLTYRAPKEEFQQWKVEFDTKTVPYFFGGLDKLLGSRHLEFFGGKSVSVADIRVYTSAWALSVLHGTANATEEFAAYPHLGPWAARMEALPSVQAFRNAPMGKLHWNSSSGNWDATPPAHA